MTKYLEIVYSRKDKPLTKYPDQFAKFISDRFKIPKNSSILEIGCGKGDFIMGFKKLGYKSFGVDIEVDPDLVSKLDIKKVDLIKDPLPYKNNSMDLIFHKSVIEHLYSPENLMKETYRVLKPRGTLVILTPNWQSQSGIFYDDFTHCRPYTPISIQNLMLAYGFKNANSEKFYQLPFVWMHGQVKTICGLLQGVLNVPMARKLAKFTGISDIRWMVETMVLGYAQK